MPTGTGPADRGQKSETRRRTTSPTVAENLGIPEQLIVRFGIVTVQMDAVTREILDAVGRRLTDKEIEAVTREGQSRILRSVREADIPGESVRQDLTGYA
jgi:hypothetical protein